MASIRVAAGSLLMGLQPLQFSEHLLGSIHKVHVDGVGADSLLGLPNELIGILPHHHVARHLRCIDLHQVSAGIELIIHHRLYGLDRGGEIVEHGCIHLGQAHLHNRRGAATRFDFHLMCDKSVETEILLQPRLPRPEVYCL